MLVSVVIPTYNRAQMLCECVDSILAGTWKEIEVIIVDDASPDNTGNAVKNRFVNHPNVRYLRNETNRFQAYSRNRGAKAATGEFILFLDDDNVVAPNLIEKLVQGFREKPDAGLIAPLSVHRRDGMENLVWTLGSDFNRWTSQPKDHLPGIPFEKLPTDTIWFPTTYSPNAFMIPRDVLAATDGFDESYVAIFEESDLGWRIMEMGKSEWILASARTEHLGFLEPGCVAPLRLLGIEKANRTFYFARNRLRFARRHFSFAQYLSVALLFAPLSALYYGATALRYHRPDIAWAYFKGTLFGGWAAIRNR